MIIIIFTQTVLELLWDWCLCGILIMCFKFPLPIHGAFLHHVQKYHVAEKRPLQKKNKKPYMILSGPFNPKLKRGVCIGAYPVSLQLLKTDGFLISTFFRSSFI